jgi:hypothetical protein
MLSFVDKTMRERLDNLTEPFDPMNPPPPPIFNGIAAAIGWIALIVALAILYSPFIALIRLILL